MSQDMNTIDNFVCYDERLNQFPWDVNIVIYYDLS